MANNTERDISCDGCGISFALRESSGDCCKCVKLLGLDRDSREYSDIVVSFSFLFAIDPLLITHRYGLNAHSAASYDAILHVRFLV